MARAVMARASCDIRECTRPTSTAVRASTGDTWALCDECATAVLLIAPECEKVGGYQ